MAIEITHVRFGASKKTEDEIILYRWRGLESGGVNSSDKPTLVTWLNDGGKAYVGSGANKVPVGVVRPQRGNPYLRTYSDGKWTNNLVNLPTF